MNTISNNREYAKHTKEEICLDLSSAMWSNFKLRYLSGLISRMGWF